MISPTVSLRSFLAPGAEPLQLQSVSENAVAAQIILLTPQKFKGWCGNIFHPAAIETSHMVVLIEIAVESCLGAAKLQFPDNPRLGHPFQVAVHRPQTDFRKPPTHDLVNPRGRGVRGKFPELFQNDLPLPGIALKWVYRHGPPSHISYYY